MRSIPCSFLIVALTGCQSTSAFEGMQYQRIELVETEYVRFNEEDRNKLRSRGKDHLLEVHFNSAHNLASLSYDNRLPIKVFSYFCEYPNEPVVLGYRYVYSGDQNLTSTASVEKIGIETNVAGLYEYSTYLHLAWLEDLPVPAVDSVEKGQMYRKFDLRETPADVCVEFFIQGYLRGHRSNTVRVPSDDIEAAINTASMSLQ